MVALVKLEQLQAFFPPARHADIAGLYRRYLRDRRLDDDVEGFIIHLHDEGLLGVDALRDILAHHEVTLSDVPQLEPGNGPPYRLVSPLGEGAMGEVFLARDPHLLRTVAVKRLKGNLKARPALLRRFVTEAQITAQLDHPAIVPIYGIHVDTQGRISYAMKFVRGKTLKDYILEARAFHDAGKQPDEDHTLRARIEAFLPVLAAMDYAHRRGVIHRDLKPENIMLGAFGEVLVMDWGIARPIGRRERVTSGESVENTRAGTLIGTPYYMSPEQARGQTEELDDKSDQYALGLILYELVTLRRALGGDTQLEVVTKAASGLHEPVVHAYGKRLPRELGAIINKATALSPDDRYPDTDAFGDDLRRLLRDESVHADPDRGLRKVKRWVGRNRGTAIALGSGSVLLIALIGAFLLWRGAETLRHEREAAYQREQQFQTLTSRVNGQASRMNTNLSRFNSLVHGMATVANQVIAEPPPEGGPDPKLYTYYKDRMDPPTPPPDANEVPAPARGGDKVSFDQADMSIAPGVDRAAVMPRARQVARLATVLKDTLMWSGGDDVLQRSDAEQRRLVLEEGVPLVWTYAAFDEGISIGFPGTWSLIDLDEDYDVRNMLWYRQFARKTGINWSTTGVDEAGLGIVMTIAESVWSPDGEYRGIVCADMTLKYFIDSLLEEPDLAKAGAESLILDEMGRVIVRSTLKEEARDAKTWKLELFDQARLLDAIKAQRSGHMTTDDGRLAVWTHLDTVQWAYVVMGEPAAMLGSPPPAP
ncbi:MAG: hypothetical protein EP329_05235 [Deltaproteobacteria bacterium]|nr:MAG: hypothetical protein EP329_05235 [Deltaproteobacteria bacterium]